MKFTAQVLAKFKKYNEYNKVFDDIYNQAAQLAAIDVMNNAKLLIQKTSNGQKVIRYGPKRSVTASKPGDPPNTDNGKLINSIKFAKNKKGYVIGTNLRYGAHLEFGTEHMGARPWLSVALKMTSEKLGDFLKQAYNNFRGKLK